MKKVSVSISGHRTSISLESEFLDALRAAARMRGISVSALILEIDKNRDKKYNLSSAIRVYLYNQKTSC